jgi:hypothetical protein
MAQAGFSLGDFVACWPAAFALVFITFNPTSYSHTNWLIAGGAGNDLAIKALAGILLLIAYVIFLRATWRSIGPLGLMLVALLFGAIGWVLTDYGLLDPGEATLMAWIVLAVVATILAIGVSWSHVRRRLSGQVDVDDVDER